MSQCGTSIFAREAPEGNDAGRQVYVVDDDAAIRKSTSLLFRSLGYAHRPYVSGADFLADIADLKAGIVLLDIRMPHVSGLDVLTDLAPHRRRLPAIVMTGHGDVETAVAAMKMGAVDFLEKPFSEAALLLALDVGADVLRNAADAPEVIDLAAVQERLTGKQIDVLSGLTEGLSNKAIAARMAISTRTVEMHRANLMKRLNVHSLADLLRLTLGQKLPARSANTGMGNGADHRSVIGLI